jgi:hypothetical protein
VDVFSRADTPARGNQNIVVKFRLETDATNAFIEPSLLRHVAVLTAMLSNHLLCISKKVKMSIVNGRLLSEKLLETSKVIIATLRQPPKVALVQVGSLPESSVYLRIKRNAFRKVGIKFSTI